MDAENIQEGPAPTEDPLLILTYEEPASHNGLNTRMRGLARALAARGRRVEIAAPVYGARTPQTSVDSDGIRLHLIPVPDLFTRGRIPIVTRALSVMCLTACLVRRLRQMETRYEWIQSEQIYPFLAAWWLARRWRSRVILDDPSLLGLFVEEKLQRHRVLRPLLRRGVDVFEKALFNRAHWVLCSSARQAAEIGTRVRGGATRVCRMGNGVDPQEFTSVPGDSPGNAIFFNCSVPYYQNTAALRNLLKIFAHFEEQGFRDYSAVVLVNDAAALPSDLAAAIRSHSRVRLRSNEKSIIPWLAGCDFVLLPYEAGHRTTAGPRLKVFEALACGKIILSTREGLDEVSGCIDGTNVIVCSDWRDMACKTMELIREGDSARKQKMRREARRLVEAEYSWGRLVKAYETIFDRGTAAEEG